MSEATPADKPGLPWENRAELGFFPAMFDTVRGVLLEPGPTFERVRGDGIGAALLYAVILGTIGGIVALVWQLAFSAIGPLIDSNFDQDLERALVETAIFAALMPVIVVAQQFVFAAIVHVCALVFGAGKHGFGATFDVIAYSFGSTATLNLVPAFGVLVAPVWGMVAAIIGISRVHETTGGRAAAAVLTPVGLCCLGTAGSIAIAVAVALGM